jgi:hypothetical protein
MLLKRCAIAAKCLVQPHHPPVNILRGYRFPDAPKVDLAPRAARFPDAPKVDLAPRAATPARSPSLVVAGDDLEIPAFLKRPS